MSYAKIQNGSVIKYPYTWADFEADNNNTNFGVAQTDANMALLFPQTDIAKKGYALVAPAPAAPPTYTASNQFAPVELPPVYVSGVLTQQWAQPVSFIPQLVSGIQLRMAVDGSSEYSAIKSFLTSQTQAIQDAYAGTGQFNRNDVLLASIITANVLTAAQVDALFVAAAGITV